ncbi:MAG TPA: hypothetical protein VN636_10865 [Acidimicrobiia bacterium]|nr:hypothetical protein [Acidimicrobiia bacterium]
MATPARTWTARVVRDARTRTLAFSLLFFAVVYANAAGYRSTYPSAADRAKVVAAFAGNKAALMFYGIGHNLVTVDGYVVWRAGGIMAVFAGLFGIFAAARPMRGDEEAGRTELVLAGALTRSAFLAATLAGILVTVVVLWLAVALGAIAGGLAARGSAFFGLTVVSVAAVYAAVGAVANQVIPTRRGALGVSGAVLGIDFLIRVVADTTDHTFVHWFTPLGWAEELRAFTGSRALVVVLPLAGIAVLVAVAGVLHARRELGGAYVAPHDTAPARTGLLSSPTALALRLDRVTIASWAVSIALFAFVVGTVAKTVEKLGIPDSLREQMKKLGGIDITQARGYVGLTFVIFVFVLALFVCAQLAAVLFLGAGVLFVALAPRLGVGLLYGFVSLAFVWELFGALLSFPNWMLDLSPFHHVAPAPAKPVAVASAAVMVGIGAAAAVLGVLRFRGRDLAGD